MAYRLPQTAPANTISFGHQPHVKSMTVPRQYLNKSAESARIAKVIARAGLCSRRDAERWILDGRVSVNGKVLDTPAFTVEPNDKVVVDGSPLPAVQAPRLFLYHKPVGLVTTARDEKRRATVFDQLPQGLPRVVSVGRLDINSEGLLLLTNDGGLARYLELPATGLKRCYRIRLHGKVNPARLAKLREGITVDGMRYGPMEAKVEGPHGGSNLWLVITLREGKNREIRKVMAHLGLQVNRLIRTAYGPFQLSNLPRGSAVEVPPNTLAKELAGYFSKGLLLQSVDRNQRH
jgi:23S rRNA pseudouridine2605 synthase